jgi:hypothetical protein
MPDAMASVLLENWFEDADEIEALERVESDGFAKPRAGARALLGLPADLRVRPSPVTSPRSPDRFTRRSGDQRST